MLPTPFKKSIDARQHHQVTILPNYSKVAPFSLIKWNNVLTALELMLLKTALSNKYLMNILLNSSENKQWCGSQSCYNLSAAP